MTDTGPPYPFPPGSQPIPGIQTGGTPIGDVQVWNVWDTIESQYANSPILTGIITNYAQAADQTANLQAFFDNIWNIGQGVNGYGLDIWGRIVGVQRVITASSGTFFGFAEASPGVSGFNEGDVNGFWGGGYFYNGVNLTTNFSLSDEAFLRLIMAKAATNITDDSIPAINQILLALFPGRGNCYVTDQFPIPDFFGFAEAQGVDVIYGFNQAQFFQGQFLGHLMQITYVFDFSLTPVEQAIVLSGVLPTPGGCTAVIVQNA